MEEVKYILSDEGWEGIECIIHDLKSMEDKRESLKHWNTLVGCLKDEIMDISDYLVEK